MIDLSKNDEAYLVASLAANLETVGEGFKGADINAYRVDFFFVEADEPVANCTIDFENLPYFLISVARDVLLLDKGSAFVIHFDGRWYPLTGARKTMENGFIKFYTASNNRTITNHVYNLAGGYLL